MYEPAAWCNLLLIVVTVVVSWLGFQHREIEEKYIFHPASILAGKEYYRLVTCAFLHAGWWHLGLNMVSLYSFGPAVEWYLGRGNFLFIYFGSVIGGSLLSLFVHRHHEYLAYGASGGVCGVIFAYILLFPGAGVRLFYSLPLPGWLYAIGFVAVSFFMMKEGRGNIGHDAHLGGAIVGLLITAGLHPGAVRENLRIFLIVLISAVLLLVYLWVNPHLLPGVSILDRPFRFRSRQAGRPRYKREATQIDAILDKIAKHGVGSLTAEEKALLDEVSGKYRRRADSKKPDSGLAI